MTVKQRGRAIDAVAQITKSGHVFVFDRVTGKPLFPIVYPKTPASAVEGERLATSQPIPVQPPPFARQVFDESMVTSRTPEARADVLERLRSLRYGGQFVPPSLEGTVVFPGFDGGGEWGGAAFDAETGFLYVNSNEMPWVLRLVDRRPRTSRTTARTIFEANCSGCHSKEFAVQRPVEQVKTSIREGHSRMPAFDRLGLGGCKRARRVRGRR